MPLTLINVNDLVVVLSAFLIDSSKRTKVRLYLGVCALNASTRSQREAITRQYQVVDICHLYHIYLREIK